MVKLRFISCAKFNTDLKKRYLPSDSRTNHCNFWPLYLPGKTTSKTVIRRPITAFCWEFSPVLSFGLKLSLYSMEGIFYHVSYVFSHVKFILLNWLRNRSLDSLVIYIDTFFKLIRLAAWAIAYVKWPKEPQKKRIVVVYLILVGTTVLSFNVTWSRMVFTSRLTNIIVVISY